MNRTRICRAIFGCLNVLGLVVSFLAVWPSISEPVILGVVMLFDTMSGKALLPLHEIDHDPVRQELDERFARDVLGLPTSIFTSGGPLELLHMKLAREPSIRGQKS